MKIKKTTNLSQIIINSLNNFSRIYSYILRSDKIIHKYLFLDYVVDWLD